MKKLELTPEDILNQEFKIDFKGYNIEEVNAYLDKVMEDYYSTEENIQELLDLVETLREQIKDLNAEIVELKGRKTAFDLSNTTAYSSVDILKRISRLEELIYNK